MEISIKEGKYIVPADFELEIEELNPLLSGKGSRSIPVTIPGYSHNLALLGNPHRIALKDKYKAEKRVVIQDGIFRRTGRQVIFSASKKGVSSTFYFKEGDFYTNIKDKSLKDIFSEIVILENTVPNIISYLNNVMKGSVQENRFAVFPVATQWESAESVETPERPSNNPDITADTTAIINYVENNTLVSQTEYEGVATNVAGYGITVFPYLNWILDNIFSYFGYKLKPTIWHINADFAKMVLLNSTADTIVKGYINFGDIVPTSQVSSFLDCICKKYNCAFDIDTGTQTAEFYFLDSVLSEKTGLKNLTPFIDGDLEITFSDAKQVRLVAKKSNDFTATETETFNEFKNKYPNIIEATEAEFQDALNSGNVVLRKANGAYYKKVGGSGTRIIYRKVSSIFFDYHQGGPISAETFETDDEFVPIIQLLRRSIPAWFFTPFVGHRRHVYTVISNNGEEQAEQTPDQKIMFCYAAGAGTYGSETWYHGTPLSCNHLGIKVRQTGLQFIGNDGIFEHFWKHTDHAMRNAYESVKGILRFPYKEFLNLNYNKLYLLHGQPVLIKSNKYAVKKGYIDFKEMDFLKV